MHNEQRAYYNSQFSLVDTDFTYGTDLSGSMRLAKALANFVSDPNGAFKPLTPIEPRDIVFGAGVTALIDMTVFHIGDSGDGILIPAPFYAGFNRDISARCGIVPIPAFVDQDDYFGPTSIDILEKMLQQYEAKGTNICAVILCNPHNPVGQCYPRETILGYAQFCQKHNIHLISDEIYAYSVFATKDNPSPEPFVSVLSIDFQKEARCDPSRIHVLYGISKDFSCNGFRAAALISPYNRDLLAALKSTSLFMKIATPSAMLWSSILEDRKYFATFQQENIRRLQAAYAYTTTWLKFHEIPYTPSNAGHFLLADLRKFFSDKDLSKSLSPLAEDGGMARDKALFERFIAKKVYLGTSSAFRHPVPGWYRITFATRKDYLVIGLARMEDALGLKRWPALKDVESFGNSAGVEVTNVDKTERGSEKNEI